MALAPGDEVEVELPDLVIERALWVPSAAIERAGERLRVFAIRDGVAHAVAVEVVDGRGDWSRVVGEGLSEGDALVLTGVGFVSDGDDVRVLRDTTPAAPSEAP